MGAPMTLGTPVGERAGVAIGVIPAGGAIGARVESTVGASVAGRAVCSDEGDIDWSVVG